MKCWSIPASLLMMAGAAALAPSVKAASPDQAWVEMAPGGSVARLVTSASACPDLSVDDKMVVMTERAAPATFPARSNKAKVDASLAFPGRVCEMALPHTARKVVFDGQPLPVPRARIDRIIVIGDTGCRLKSADKAWQGCNDPVKWPFAAIATRAAAMKPDLVLHVGDYLYRENGCPADQADCAGSVWGYDEASWRADFLAPAAPLLAAAPWVMVRGNHEECARAGEGWWRLLDPHAVMTGQDCRDPANDALGDRGVPYAVDLGQGARIAVADLVGLANAGKHDEAQQALYRADFEQISQLLHGSRFGVITAHYPVNPVMWQKDSTSEVAIGAKPIKALGSLDLKGANVMIAGHIHEFQIARFADRPAQVIAGFSGTYEDTGLSPTTLADAASKPGAAPLKALTTIQNTFGFCLMVRKGKGWSLIAYGVDGNVLGRFRL